MDWWRASTSMRCGLATFGSRVLVRSVPAVRPLIYLLTYLNNDYTYSSTFAQGLSRVHDSDGDAGPCSAIRTRSDNAERTETTAVCNGESWSYNGREEGRSLRKASLFHTTLDTV